MRFYNGRVLEERKRSVGDVLMFQTLFWKSSESVPIRLDDHKRFFQLFFGICVQDPFEFSDRLHSILTLPGGANGAD
ncbi:MAG: hypothetical protein KatS3mg058_3237 [Roseiflexus sp.]|jgi:hypothetical protein|nr:MAG: hypothetical protein KatS3mg058_3237 [Roseiflexus sp.]